MAETERSERLQIEITVDELKAIDNFRFGGRYRSRAAAVRELIRRGLLDKEKDPPPESK